MRNKRMSFKRLLSTFMVMVCLCVPSLTVFAQTDEEMRQEAVKDVPEVYFTVMLMDTKNLNLYLILEPLRNQHQNGLGVMEHIM